MHNDTHDYETTTVKGSDLNSTHVLVGESGGLSAIYEVHPSSFGFGLLDVRTEHGLLLLDPNAGFEVIAE